MRYEPRSLIVDRSSCALNTVVLMELVKLLVSLLMLLLGFKVASAVPLRSLPSHVASLCGSRGMLLMGVPGLLYFIMNQLVFVGLQNLDAATFSLMSQTKLITTASQTNIHERNAIHTARHATIREKSRARLSLPFSSLARLPSCVC